MADLLDFMHERGSPITMMHRLERRGLIRVWSFQRSRVVEMIESGKKTAAPENTTPHWRDKRRAGDMTGH